MSQVIQIGRRRCRASRSVSLVAFDWTREHDPRVPLGHASIEACLRAAGVEITPHVFSVRTLDIEGESRVVQDILDARREVVAIGVYAWNDPVVRRVIRGVRAQSSAQIVLGGPQITYAPVEQLKAWYPEADVFIRGPGEDALATVLSASNVAPVDGVVWAAGGASTAMASVDLAGLPSPYLTGALAVSQGQRMVRWETSRGCSYACSFCAHPGAPEQRRIARRDRNTLRQELALFVERDVQRINVLDPLFNANAAHATDVLADMLAAGVSAEVTFQCRFAGMRSGTVALLDRFCRLNAELEFGLQTTDDAVARAVDRGDEVERADAVIQLLTERRIRFLVSLIYGLPGQTLASFERSVAWCLERAVPHVRAYPLSLLVGTKLWRQAGTLGLIEGRSDDTGDVPVVIETPWMSRSEMKCAGQLARQLDATAT